MSMIYFKDYDFSRFDIKTFDKKDEIFVDNIFTHDIEVSSFFVVDGEVKSLNDILYLKDPEKVEAIFDSCECGSVPYIWQFSIDDDIIFGRDYFDFVDFLHELSNEISSCNAKAFVYVHNLAYEYSFMREIFKDHITDILLTENRKPLFVEVFGNIEFRCSYRLTNLSLAKWGESIGVNKKTGDLDYGVLRSPYTDLTPTELGYCEFDLRVMIAGLRKYRDEYGSIQNIPLTQTGEVRRPIRAINQKVRGQMWKFAECMPATPTDIGVQQHCFMGGLTLSNIVRTNKVLRGVLSEDIASAYPTEIFRNKYPSCGFFSSPFMGEESLTDGNHHIMLVTFEDLEAKYPIAVIPFSKRIAVEGATTDGDDSFSKNNGKIIKAKKLSMYVTEKDFLSYRKLYDFKAEVHEHYIATSDYIPKSIIEFMLGLYEKKTKLKHADYDLYMKSKQMLNSIYGMMVSSPFHNEFYEEDFEPKFRYLNCDEIQAALDEYRKKPYKNVVPYSWGIYVTANQRARIIDAISYFCERGECDKIIYLDTDSLKGFFDYHFEYEEDGTECVICDEEFFLNQNKRILAECRAICKERGIPFEKYSPEDDTGTKHPLGLWENDGLYDEFKTCGAKRYAYKDHFDKKIHTTIAGVPKRCAYVLHSVDDLREGLKFDVYNSAKNLLTYLDGDNPRVVLPDGYEVKNTCGVNMRPTSYSLTFTDDYRSLLSRYEEYRK